ncbi:MAG: rod shape-determining protein [Candidatus Eremiobacterota bacterium]
MHLGVDLGTTRVAVATRSKGIVLRMPALVAADRNSGRIVAVGEEAQKLLAQPAGSIVPVRPLRDGAVASREAAEAVLEACLKKVRGLPLSRPDVWVSVPSEVTPVERRGVVEAALAAGARRAHSVPAPLAAAVGAGLQVEEPEGLMVVDIGGGCSDVGVISLRSVVVPGTIRVGGNRMDEAVGRMLRRVHNLMAGEATVENLKLQLGSALPSGENRTLDINGQDLVDGLPRTVTVTEEEVRSALEEPLIQIVDGLRAVLERTPAELSGDIYRSGILLTGGAARLRGLDQLLERLLGVPTRLAAQPEDCVALGAARLGG